MVSISLNTASNSGIEDIQGFGFDLNGDVNALFTNGSMAITKITAGTISGDPYTGTPVLDIEEQNAGTPFNDQPIDQTTSPFDATIDFGQGSSDGTVQTVSFLITDSAQDVDAKALLDNTAWYVRTQSTVGGEGSAKTAGAAPVLEDCDDHPDDDNDFPELTKDISNVVFYFKAGYGPGKVDPGRDVKGKNGPDGFYTGKVDNWFDEASNDLDDYYDDIFDWLVDNDLCIDADDIVLGVAIKSGKNAFAAGNGVFSVATQNDTAYFAVGDGDTDPDALPSPLTKPITGNHIDPSVNFDDVFMMI